MQKEEKWIGIEDYDGFSDWAFNNQIPWIIGDEETDAAKKVIIYPQDWERWKNYSAPTCEHTAEPGEPIPPIAEEHYPEGAKPIEPVESDDEEVNEENADFVIYGRVTEKTELLLDYDTISDIFRGLAFIPGTIRIHADNLKSATLLTHGNHLRTLLTHGNHLRRFVYRNGVWKLGGTFVKGESDAGNKDMEHGS